MTLYLGTGISVLTITSVLGVGSCKFLLPVSAPRYNKDRCTEFGWFQTEAPEGLPTIVSDYINLEFLSYLNLLSMRTWYYQLTCVALHLSNVLPETFHDKLMSAHPAVDAMNTKFGGWNIHVDRVFFANGLSALLLLRLGRTNSHQLVLTATYS
ncbi:hypothetical protein BDZ89DRAFT_1138100 [Hymenopellis radicata]|nr:hypothetical protein BDZ89DRAFT_1138100 [Hymenopellis radicata]